MGAGMAWGSTPARFEPASAIALKNNPPVATRAAEDILSAYLTIDDATLDRAALDRLGVRIILETSGLATARIPASAVAALAEVEGVEYIQLASPVSQMLDLARPEVGGDRVRQGEGLQQGYTGKGVIVGVVDSGFDYGHAAFRDSEGNLRIKRIWEQGTTPSGGAASPEKFGYGMELTSPEAILEAEGDIRNNSHGTHVTAIAAGSDASDNNRVLGMAPDAEIVLVSLNGDTDASVDISNAIAYIFDYADAEGKPCVINLSLGAHNGPHDGTSAFDRIADSLQGPGRLIVGSAGNHRQNKFHAEHRFASADEAPMRTFVDYLRAITTANAGGDIEVWGDEGQDIEVALLCYNVNSGEVAERVVLLPAGATEGSEATDVSLGRNIAGNLTAATELNPTNGKWHVAITSGVTSIRTNYAVAIEVVAKTPGKVDIWADNVKLGLTSKGLEGFTDGDASTIAEIGGTAQRIMTVGAYTTRSKYTRFNESDVLALDETDGEICSFSSAGPTADGRVKPNIAAPGCYVSSAVSSNDGSGTLVVSYAYETPERSNMYGYMQGTSMASPLVAGVVATWLQAYPELTPEALADIMQRTARKDEFTGELATPDNDWGFGKVDAYAGLRECLVAAHVQNVEAAATPAPCLSVSGEEIGILFDAEYASARLDIYNAQGGLTLSREFRNTLPGEQKSVSITALPAGVYILRMATPQGERTLKFNR